MRHDMPLRPPEQTGEVRVPNRLVGRQEPNDLALCVHLTPWLAPNFRLPASVRQSCELAQLSALFAAETLPLRKSAVIEAGSRSAGSPQPPPPPVSIRTVSAAARTILAVLEESVCSRSVPKLRTKRAVPPELPPA